jgi:uncharacterized protein (DUF697 family)
MTTKYSALTAVASFVTQPIPVVDEIVVIPIHYWFAGSVTRRHGRGVLGAPWWQLHKIIWGGVGVRAVSRFTLGFVPLAGAISNAITATCVTELLSEYLDEALGDRDRRPPKVTVRSLLGTIKRRITGSAAPRSP